MKFTYSEHTSGQSILTALREPGWQLPSLFTCSSMWETSALFFWKGFAHQNKDSRCILQENSSLFWTNSYSHIVFVSKRNPIYTSDALHVLLEYTCMQQNVLSGQRNEDVHYYTTTSSKCDWLCNICQGKKAHLSCQYSHLHSPTILSYPESPLPVLLSLKLILHRSG